MPQNDYRAERFAANLNLMAGSSLAVVAGCECPVMDNSYGLGIMGLGEDYYYNLDCPLHNSETSHWFPFFSKFVPDSSLRMLVGSLSSNSSTRLGAKATPLYLIPVFNLIVRYGAKNGITAKEGEDWYSFLRQLYRHPANLLAEMFHECLTENQLAESIIQLKLSDVLNSSLLAKLVSKKDLSREMTALVIPLNSTDKAGLTAAYHELVGVKAK